MTDKLLQKKKKIVSFDLYIFQKIKTIFIIILRWCDMLVDKLPHMPYENGSWYTCIRNRLKMISIKTNKIFKRLKLKFVIFYK